MSIEDIGRAWDDVRFWQQIEGDAKRTVVVHPDHVDYVRAAVKLDHRGRPRSPGRAGRV